MPASLANLSILAPASTLLPAPGRAGEPNGSGGADFARHLDEAQAPVRPDPPSEDTASKAAASRAGKRSAKAAAGSSTRKDARKSVKRSDRHGETQQDDAAESTQAGESPRAASGDATSEDTSEDAESKAEQAAASAEAAKDVTTGADPRANAGIAAGATAPTPAIAKPTDPASPPAGARLRPVPGRMIPFVQHAGDGDARTAPVPPEGKAPPQSAAPDAVDAKIHEAATVTDANEPAVGPLDQAPPQKPAKPIPAAVPATTNATDANVASSAPADDADSAAEPKTADILDAANQLLATGFAHAQQPHPAGHDTAAASGPQQGAPSPSPELHFADANHVSIVSGVRAELLPHGGSMQIRLDPPELGALQVTVEMRDGTVNATFQTSNDEATRLLSHSLGQLKTALEAQGVSVDKIQVQQAPRDHGSHTPEDSSQQQQQRDDANARQEQQRREMLRKMWQRIAVGRDPVDLVA